jgi:hypothetical protein
MFILFTPWIYFDMSILSSFSISEFFLMSTVAPEELCPLSKGSIMIPPFSL